MTSAVTVQSRGEDRNQVPVVRKHSLGEGSDGETPQWERGDTWEGSNRKAYVRSVCAFIGVGVERSKWKRQAEQGPAATHGPRNGETAATISKNENSRLWRDVKNPFSSKVGGE